MGTSETMSSDDQAGTPRSPMPQEKAKSKRRKNVSIGFATWSRLRTHGIYGDSLDDILNRLMDKADQLSRRDSKSANSSHAQDTDKGQSQRQIQQKEGKLMEQSRSFRVFEKDIVEPKTGERSVSGERSIEMVIPLPGIRFPIDKSELLDFAIYLDKELEYDQIAVGGFYYGQFMDLPDKTYMNRANLEEALVVLSNTPGHGHQGVKLVGVKLLTTKEELEGSYYDSSKRQADDEFRKADGYYKLGKEQKQKVIEEQKRKLMEDEKRSQEARRFDDELKRQQDEYERRELEQQRKGEQEMEEAAVKGEIDKPFRPVGTDLLD